MRTPLHLLAALAVLSVLAHAAAGDIKLPEPKKSGGMPLFEALNNRSSFTQNDAPTKPPSQEDLSTILWAASGLNRDGKLWTVPMAMGKPPYCKIYVTDGTGAYRYDWKAHSLVQVSKDNVNADIPMQQMVKDAPMILYIVGDSEELTKLKSPFESEFALVLAGSMSQDIALACQALGVKTRVIYSIKRDEATRLLKLNAKDTPFFAMPIGRQ